jgi:hypothetical protein
MVKGNAWAVCPVPHRRRFFFKHGWWTRIYQKHVSRPSRVDDTGEQFTQIRPIGPEADDEDITVEEMGVQPIAEVIHPILEFRLVELFFAPYRR